MAKVRSFFAPALAIVFVLGGCAVLPPGSDYPKSASSAYPHPELTRLGRQFDNAGQVHGGHSGYRIIAMGAEGFQLRMQMIDAAERSIDLQYFIFRGDQSGLSLTKALLRAADRGVRLRLLVDDGETKDGDEQLAMLEAHPSIEVRIFNPFVYRGHSMLIRVLEFGVNASRLDYRMHNKLLAVDNAIALIGGRNIGDQYFQIDPQSQFADDDVFAAGPITKQLSATFDDYWNNALSIPAQALSDNKSRQETLHAHRRDLREHDRQTQADGNSQVRQIASGEPLAGIISGRLPLVWAPAQLVSDSPDKRKVQEGSALGKLMQRSVLKVAAAVSGELLMITPYLIPGDEGLQLLRELRQRKVRVRILTNSLESSTVLLAQARYMNYRLPLLESGVELYEIRSLLGNARGSGQTAAISRYGNYSLHAKLFVFDRRKLFIGSMNFDQRSMHLNTEIGLIIDSPVLAQQVAARFEAMVQPANSYRLALRRREVMGTLSLEWHTREDGKPVVLDREPGRSDWQRLKANALSLLPVDDEL